MAATRKSVQAYLDKALARLAAASAEIGAVCVMDRSPVREAFLAARCDEYHFVPETGHHVYSGEVFEGRWTICLR